MPGFFQGRSQRSPLDVLHHHVGRAPRPVHLMHPDHMRVTKPPEDVRPVHESDQAPLVVFSDARRPWSDGALASAPHQDRLPRHIPAKVTGLTRVAACTSCTDTTWPSCQSSPELSTRHAPIGGSSGRGRRARTAAHRPATPDRGRSAAGCPVSPAARRRRSRDRGVNARPSAWSPASTASRSPQSPMTATGESRYPPRGLCSWLRAIYPLEAKMR